MGAITVLDVGIGVNFYETDATPQFPVGQMLRGANGGEFIYARIPVALTRGNYCVLTWVADGDWTATASTAANVITSPVHGVAMATAAAGRYGWFAVRGAASDLVVTVGANTPISPTTSLIVQTIGTAGIITAAATLAGGQSALMGIAILQATTPAAAVRCQLIYPRFSAI